MAEGGRVAHAESYPDLLSILAHELAQPVTAALGLAQAVDARYDELHEPTKRLTYVGVVRNLKQVRMLIENLRLFTNMDSGTIPLNLASLSMRELLEDAVEDFHERLGGRSIEIDCDKYLRVNADVMLLRQVLSNLLSNAVKFSRPDSTIEIGARANGNRLEITVGNEGVGFPSAESKRIFERTVQLHPESGGLGFGLYVAKAIVDAHGGQIWAESEPDKGAVFHVSLPHWPIQFS